MATGMVDDPLDDFPRKTMSRGIHGRSRGGRDEGRRQRVNKRKRGRRACGEQVRRNENEVANSRINRSRRRPCYCRLTRSHDLPIYEHEAEDWQKDAIVERRRRALG